VSPSRLLPVPLDRKPAVPAELFDPRLLSPAHEVDAGIDWRRVLSALARYKWLVMLVTVLGTGLGVVATRLLDPVYVAQATIWIDEGDRAGTERGGPIRPGQLLRSVSWPDLLESYVVLDAVVREQRLFVETRSPEDAAALASLGVAEEFRPGEYRLTVDASGAGYVLVTADGGELERGVVGDSIGARLGLHWAPPPGGLPVDRSIPFTLLAPRDAARRLADDLQVRMDYEGNFLRFELRGVTPTRITAIVNAVAERFVNVAADMKRRKLTELTRILGQQLESAQATLSAADLALEAFRVRTITLPTERAGGRAGAGTTAEGGDDPMLGRFFDMQLERDQLRRDRAAIARVLSDSGASMDRLNGISTVRAAGALSDALREWTAKQAELRALRYRYADEYPPLQRLTQDLATLEQRTIPELARGVIAEVTAREAELDRRVGATGRDLRGIPPRALEEARLRRASDLAATLYTTLQQRYEEARLAEASTTPDVRILDPAMVPREPVKNTAPRLVLMAFCASLGLAGLGAVVRDRIDQRVRYPEEVSRDMGLPILGAVPHLQRDRAGGELTPDAASETVEALRGVRMSILHAAQDRRPLRLTITSAGPGEGKSFVSTNLGLAFAEAGYRTLLIDGDIRRGAQHRCFGVPRRPGLSDYLSEQALLGDIVRRTQFPSLCVVSCGTRASAAPELLGSARMETLVRELSDMYDVILCDSPPLSAGVDPFVLGALTEDVLMVVRTGVSNREMARAKLEVLSRLSVRLVGAVLNDVPAGGRHGYHGYSYYVAGYEATDEHAGTADAVKRVI